MVIFFIGLFYHMYCRVCIRWRVYIYHFHKHSCLHSGCLAAMRMSYTETVRRFIVSTRNNKRATLRSASNMCSHWHDCGCERTARRRENMTNDDRWSDAKLIQIHVLYGESDSRCERTARLHMFAFALQAESVAIVMWQAVRDQHCHAHAVSLWQHKAFWVINVARLIISMALTRLYVFQQTIVCDRSCLALQSCCERTARQQLTIGCISCSTRDGCN